MKSILWFTVGVAAGFVVAHQVNQTKQGRDFFSSVDAKRSARSEQSSGVRWAPAEDGTGAAGNPRDPCSNA